MSILNKLIAVLGLFWVSICRTPVPRYMCELMSGILASVYKHRQQAILLSIAAFSIPRPSRVSQTNIQLDSATVRKAKVPVTSMSAGLLALILGTDAGDSSWWACRLVLVPSAAIHIIQSALTCPEHVLVRGADFYILGDTLYTKANPALLGLPAGYIAKSPTLVLVVYQAVAITLNSPVRYSMFDDILDTSADTYKLRHILWRMRMLGLTPANLTIMCGLLLDTPVSLADTLLVVGIDNIGLLWYVYTDTGCYMCKRQPSVTAGDRITRGTPLCPGMRVYTSTNYKLCTLLTALLVRTPVGMLTALPVSQTCRDLGILPLTDTLSCTYAEYANYIQTTYSEYKTVVPAAVNPVDFIISSLLGGSFILIAVDDMPDKALLKLLKKRLSLECPASSVVYICDLTTGKARLLYSIILEM